MAGTLQDYINSITDANQLQTYLDSYRNTSGENKAWGEGLTQGWKDYLYKGYTPFQKFLANNGMNDVTQLESSIIPKEAGGWAGLDLQQLLQNRLAGLRAKATIANTAAQKAVAPMALTTGSELQNLESARTNLLANATKNYQTELRRKALNTQYDNK